jgi:hypothetical protein
MGPCRHSYSRGPWHVAVDGDLGAMLDAHNMLNWTRFLHTDTDLETKRRRVHLDAPRSAGNWVASVFARVRGTRTVTVSMIGS